MRTSSSAQSAFSSTSARASGRSASAVRNASSVGIRSPANSAAVPGADVEPLGARRGRGRRPSAWSPVTRSRSVSWKSTGTPSRLSCTSVSTKARPVHRELERGHRVLGGLGAIAAVPHDERGLPRQPRSAPKTSIAVALVGVPAMRISTETVATPTAPASTRTSALGGGRTARSRRADRARAGHRGAAARWGVERSGGRRAVRSSGRSHRRRGSRASGLSTDRAPLRGGCPSL